MPAAATPKIELHVHLEGAVRHVYASDARNCLLREQCPEEFAFAAAEVEHARGSALFQRRDDRAEALFVQADPLFNGLLLSVVTCLGAVRIDRFLGDQAS